MKTYNTYIAAFVAGLVLIFGGEIRAGEPNGQTFILSSENSTLTWKGSKPGGPHYGTVEIVSGNLETDGSEITGGKFSINLQTIICDDLKNKTFNKKLVDHLKSEDFFHTEKYPEAFFVIIGIVKDNSEIDGFASTHSITGSLTIKDITREISFLAKLEMEDSFLNAQTSDIVLDRTLWDVNYNSKKFLSGLANNYIDDEMVIRLDLKFKSR